MNECVYDVIVNGLDAAEVCVPTEVDNLSIIPATIQLAGAEIEIVPTISREIKLKKALDKIKEEYEYILIDCQPSLGLLTINALTAADSVLIPVHGQYYALDGISVL